MSSFVTPSTHVFRGFWHGPPLNPILVACLRSFLACGHSFELYVYDSITAPEGVELKSAAAVLQAKQLFNFQGTGSSDLDFGPFSDLFRFKLLMVMGGWWSDVDCLCLSDNIPRFERAWARECPEFHPGAIGTSQIALRKGDPVAKALFEQCLARVENGFSRREDLGPRLISKVIKELGLPLDMGGTPNSFYPLRWIEIFKLWLSKFYDEITEKAKSAHFMPIYQSFPLACGLSMQKLPPRGSFLERACTELARDLRDTDRYTEEEILESTRRFFREKKEWAMDELIAVSGDDILRQIGL